MTVDDADARAIASQLGRKPRGMRRVAHRCDCGLPSVVETEPRLDDGTPFPTFYYLTCKCLASACSKLESEGFMRVQELRLQEDQAFADSYRHAHNDYLMHRDAIENVPEIEGVTAGGMPERVKCLHALVAHSLATGPGVNLVGDAALSEIDRERIWPRTKPCIEEPK